MIITRSFTMHRLTAFGWLRHDWHSFALRLAEYAAMKKGVKLRD